VAEGSNPDEILNIDVLQALMDGYNSTLIVFGQSSSGKTHSCLGGTQEDGLLALSVKNAFQRVEEGKIDCLFSFAACEIWKERILDLQNNEELKVREEKTKGFFLESRF
jgi:Kinesin motor domain